MHLFRRLAARWKYRHFDRDLRRELESHRAMADDDLAELGVPEDARRRIVAQQIGNVTLQREEARRVWIARWLDSLRQDLRYAVRRLRASPGYAAATLIILIAAIGLNTAVFSVANALLLRPWMLPDPDQLVLAFHVRPDGRAINVPFAEYRFLAGRMQAADLVVSREGSDLTLDGEGAAGAIRGHFVSANFFSTLRVPLALGTGFPPSEDDENQPRFLAVVSHGFWESRLGQDSAALTRSIGVNGHEFRVVGVTLPGNFLTPGRGMPDVWLPFSTLPALFPNDAFARELLSNPNHCCVELAGRLRPGVTREQARAELETLDRQFLTAVAADSDLPETKLQLVDTRGLNNPRGGAQQAVRMFALLSAGVLLLLLLACANLGNLHLARAAARKPEIAVRMSLGAGRGRIVRQILTESLLLAAAAAAVAVALGAMLPGIVLRQALPSVLTEVSVDPNWPLLLFGAAMAVVTSVATGLVPALRVTRDLRHSPSASRETHRLRALLLTVQVAASVALLFGAISLARGVARGASLDPGFDVTGVSVLSVERRAGDERERVTFNRALTTALEAARIGPYGLSALEPLGNARVATGVTRPGELESAERTVRVHGVSAGYFAVLGIPFRAGTAFDPTAPNVVVVNETFARMLWPNASAVGQRFNDKVVAGVVADAHIDGLSAIDPTYFEPLGSSRPFILVRNTGGTAERVQSLIAGLDSEAIVTERRLAVSLSDSLQGARLGAVVAGVLGSIALLLATVGIAGVFSYVVAERRREIGIRRAVGASSLQVVEIIGWRAGLPLAVGLAAGVGLALIVGPALRGFLFGLAPHDPLALAGTTVACAIAATVSAALPLWRAVRINPAETLRQE